MINDDFFDPGDDQKARLRAELLALQEEHRDLHQAIARLGHEPSGDELLVRRLKKRKLSLKDRITEIKRSLHPAPPDDIA